MKTTELCRRWRGGKHVLIGTVCLSSVWLAACSPKSDSVDLPCVKVAAALDNLTELKLSELGNQVRLVALETTDSSLVGNHPNLLLLDHHLVVYTQKECLLFDKASGRFIARVGQLGEGPEHYTLSFPFYHPYEQQLYFKRRPHTLQGFDLQGRYRGQRELPHQPDVPVSLVFTPKETWGYCSAMSLRSYPYPLLSFDASGAVSDSLSCGQPEQTAHTMKDISGIRVHRLQGGLRPLS